MNTLSLESLLLLFAKSNERLLYYKTSQQEDEEMTKLYKRIIQQIKNIIVAKRAESPPMK